MSWFMQSRNALAGRAAALACGVLAVLAGPAAAVAEEAPIDRELGKYWNVELAVPSLEHPLFERKGAFEASAHIGILPNDNFYLAAPVGGRLAYHVADTLAVEGNFSYQLSTESDLLNFLNCPTGDSNCTSLTAGGQAPPKLNWTSSVGVVWSPFHGKLGVFASKISSFDLNFSAGFALLGADIDESPTDAKRAESAVKPGGTWGAGMRFFLTDAVNLRVDYRQFMYKPQESISFLAPVEFTLGVAYLLK